MRLFRGVVTIVALVTYISLPTKNYYWDGIWFAQTIEDATRWPQLLHPNHLFYNLLGYGLYHILGGWFRALYVLQAMDAVFGAATVYVLFRIVWELTQSERTTLLLVGLFAFAGTWWRFATDADAYIPSVFFLTLSALHLLPGRKPRPLRAALLHSAAMLVHQLAVFFFPAAMLALWNQSQGDDRKQRIRRAIEYTAAALPLTLGAYYLGFRAKEAAGSGFWGWMTMHSPDAKFSFSLLRDTYFSLRSWPQLFLVGRFTYVHMTSPGTISFFVLAAGAGVLAVVDLARHGLPRDITIRHRDVFRWALLWTGAYALFLLVWLPQNTFYKLFALPALILLAASCAVPDAAHPKMRSLAWLVAAGVFWNLACGIIPYSHIESNKAVYFAWTLREDLQSGAVVYYSNINPDDSLVRYFSPRARWVRATEPATIDADLARGESVWVDTSAIDRFSREAPAWFAARIEGAPWHQLVEPGYRIRFVQLRLPPAR